MRLGGLSFLVVLVGIYLGMTIPLASYMRDRPFQEKVGYVPQGEVMKLLCADQKQSVAAFLVTKVFSYYGGAVARGPGPRPDHAAMRSVLEPALKLDPYNMDGYYFAQGILTWETRQIAEANALLDYGMQYRTWDWYLPFFAGFNSAYFLKDYAAASRYYQRAAQLSGSELFANLAGRYMHASGRTDLALIYLETMEKGARNEAVKTALGTRLQALKEVRRIEMARDQYQEKKGALPASVEELIRQGFLKESPVDPYGGTFYFEPSGQVSTTSKFAFGTKKSE